MNDWVLPMAVTLSVCAFGWLAGRESRRSVRETEARDARYETLPRCGQCGAKWDPEDGLHECGVDLKGYF